MPSLSHNDRDFMFNSTKIIKTLLVIILIPIGLLTKVYSGIGSEFVANYLGGIIYVIFFILLASLVFPKVTSLKISFYILCITCLLEFSQLIQVSFLNNLRKYFIIRALIGSAFNVFDFVFYFIGAFLGFGILSLISKTTIKKNKI
jgi:hypothetical protein